MTKAVRVTSVQFGDKVEGGYTKAKENRERERERGGGGGGGSKVRCDV